MRLQYEVLSSAFTHSGVEAELGQVVSWGELPGVLQIESHCTGVTLRCGDESTKCTLCKPDRTIIDLETSDWERPAVEREKEEYVIISRRLEAIDTGERMQMS